MHTVKVVENGLEASQLINVLKGQGYNQDNIFIFAHDKTRSTDLTEATHTGSVGLKEQGMVDTVTNLFKKRGDELRSKFQSLGLSESEAGQYEEVLDDGKVVVVASDEV